MYDCDGVCVCAGHGLQWLWPFLIGYSPHKTAVLDEVCIVYPRDDLQKALKSTLYLQLQHQSLAVGHELGLTSALTQLKQSWTGKKQLPPMPEYTPEVLSEAPGIDFLPLRYPGGQQAKQEIEMQLKQYAYKSELYGVKDRSADLVEAVFQPWYQEMLDMGNIQVHCCETSCSKCHSQLSKHLS